MASKVMASSNSTTNSDLNRQASIYSLTIAELQNSNKGLGSMSMDDLLRNIWTAEESQAMAAALAGNQPDSGQLAGNMSDSGQVMMNSGSFPHQNNLSLPKQVANKTVEEVWRELASSSATDQRGERMVYKEPTFGEMTLEDFLAKAGIVREENQAQGVCEPSDWRRFGVKGDEMVSQQSMFGDGVLGVQGQFQRLGGLEEGGLGSNNNNGLGLGLGHEGSSRGKRRAVHEPVDKVAQQRQRRMIKNRESAARSRERKQAYTVELETLVTQLEEENAQLQAQQVEENRKRREELMKVLIPVDEMPRPPRMLRRTRSMHL
ncbi:hypothetical protein AMTRI_Chr11g94400 [Amborella trichopoda]|uniref:BZIP domain-containing protein n=1 Tax=Amborella trichopoda TaxID=13333 RepID=W1PY53_AMBTC|nr:ABSCISIC ACID-INSENSITIVE 5-like protein 6 [Amborella trichopoda]ERN12984.1 hypothetical protein AMTR_s00040p00057740 [Amborella trichopoda]|eukprot:XP_020527287.1 ABSCISIC ACID-INSENSITIVE 5-like protein 6 [Amborella trichopoda]